MGIDYSDISKTYDNYRSYPKLLINKMIEVGEICEGKYILDMGCGTGSVAAELMKQINLNITGVDKSIHMLKIARKKSLEIICADVNCNHLPFNNNSFDIALGAYVIHQFNNLSHLFSECHRILRNDGLLVLLTSSHKQIEHQHAITKQFFPSFIEKDKARFPDIPEIESILSSAGFQKIKHQEVLIENLPIDHEYLQKVKNKYISTYYLLPQQEYLLGVKKLEAFIKEKSGQEYREWRCTLISGEKTVKQIK